MANSQSSPRKLEYMYTHKKTNVSQCPINIETVYLGSCLGYLYEKH